MESLQRQLSSIGQEHLLQFYNELSDQQKAILENDINEVQWDKLNSIYEQQVRSQLVDKSVKTTSKIDDSLLEELPTDIIEGTTISDSEKISQYTKIGLEAIGQGKVAALLLAGGQGTRLGADYPKGMYDVGLPNNKTLFQLQADRLKELSSLAKSTIVWYVMTSGATKNPTRKYFEENNYFGLERDDVVFFEQNTVPCFSFDGKILLDEKFKLSRSPNGNGGLYEALSKNELLDHMSSRGICYVHTYCVDNILVRVCDPKFIGYCIYKQVEAGAKVVEKINPSESVGIICKVSNRFKVIEYSEISDAISQKLDTSGRLAFNASNICEHFFTVDFLKQISDGDCLRYHIAVKKIPYISLETGERLKPTEPNGIKLEKFIFDVFEFTDKFAVWQVKREDEFSPLKNSDTSPKDNPTTARNALLRAYDLGLLTV